jgi:hypothetical protein
MGKQLSITYVADGKGVKKELADMDSAHGKFGKGMQSTGAGVKGVLGELTDRFGGFGGTVVSEMGRANKGMSGAITVAAGMAVGVAAAVYKAAEAFADYAVDVRLVRDISGATAEDASKLLAVMDDLGVSPEQGAKAMQKFSRELDDGGAAIDKWFTKAEQAELKGKSLTETIPVLAEKFQSLDSPIERNAFLMDNFGKSGEVMRRLLQLSAGDFKAMADQAERLGLIMSDKDIVAAENYAFAIDDLQDSFLGLKLSLGREVIPLLTSAAEKSTEAVGGFNKWKASVDGAEEALDKALPWLDGFVHQLLTGAPAADKQAAANDKVSLSLQREVAELEKLDQEIEQGAVKALENWNKASADMDKRLDTFLPKFGETFKAASDVSVSSLKSGFEENTRNLEGFVSGLSALGPRVQKIAGDDISGAFLARLAEMGPGASGIIDQLNTTSDEKLKELVDVFGGNIKAAKAASDLEFDKYPDNWSGKIQAANRAVFGRLDELVTQFNAVPTKTGPMATGLAKQIDSTIAEILAMQRAGTVALTPLQEQALIAAARMKEPEEKARALERALRDMGGVDPHVDMSASDGITGKAHAAANAVRSIPTTWTTFLRTVSTGAAVGGLTAGLSGRAAGGPVRKDTPYIVGERGREVFVPNSNGTIIPNGGSGGAQGGAPGVIILDGRAVGQWFQEYQQNELRANPKLIWQ